MTSVAARSEAMIVRRVFEAWSIEIPASFSATFIRDGVGYWHAYDDRRSVSLTSMTIHDGDRPVSAQELARQVPPVKGKRVTEFPDGLPGWAITAAAPKEARASRLLTGVVATEGRLLLATITADDLDWARRIWLSIRCHRPISLNRLLRRRHAARSGGG